MRWTVRFLAVLVAVAVVVLPGAGRPAAAAREEQHGWWWRSQSGLLGVDVPPPAGPDDGLVVEQSVDGPSALAAVRFGLDAGEGDPVLTLPVTSGAVGAIGVDACPAASFWDPAQAGRWDAAPRYDCEAGRAAGEPNDAGDAWTFALGPLVRDGTLDVVLVPSGEGAGRIGFAAPDDAALASAPAEEDGGGGSGGSGGVTPPPPPSTTGPSSAGFSPGGGATSGDAPPPTFGQAPPPTTGAPTAVAAPQVAPPASAGTGTPLVAAPDVAASAGTRGTEGLGTWQVAALSVLASWVAFDLFSRRGAWSPAMTSAGAVGGLGRFRRRRDSAPVPLR